MNERSRGNRREFGVGALGGIAAALLAGRIPGSRCEAAARRAELGVNASLGAMPVFPLDNPWNRVISDAPADPNSGALIAGIGLDKGLHPDFGTVYAGAPNGIPYVVVPGDQPRVPVRFE